MIRKGRDNTLVIASFAESAMYVYSRSGNRYFAHRKTLLAGISKALIAKLVRDEVIFPVSGKKTYYDDMDFHESALRVIKRWEEEIMRRR